MAKAKTTEQQEETVEEVVDERTDTEREADEQAQAARDELTKTEDSTDEASEGDGPEEDWDNEDAPLPMHEVKHVDLGDGAYEAHVVHQDGSVRGSTFSGRQDGHAGVAVKRAENYYAQREQCPACGRIDGIRKGNTWCDSCGSHFA